MARTLPWLTKPSAKSAQPPPSKKQKLLHPSSDSEANFSSKPPHKPKRNPFHQNAIRTPSTSPPPQPPSQHTMRPGFDADDGYIMVEDEFLATAQLYTRHLHHAEYQRLKNLARTRHSQISDPDITRPVSTTLMRDELRRKKTAEARSRKVDAGLDPILSKQKHQPKDDEASDSDLGLEKDDDPWQGTQLQRFMTVSPRKERGLTGLQSVVSYTRAAAGFAAPERDSKGALTPRKTVGKRIVAEASASETNDEDDDDLDLPPTRGSTIPPAMKAHQRSPSPSKPRNTLGTSILHRPLNKPTTRTTTAASSKPLPPSSHNKTSKQHPAAPSAHPPKRSFLDLQPLPQLKIKPEPNIKTEPNPSTPSSHSSPSASPPAYNKPESRSSQPRKLTTLQQRLKAHRERTEREKRGGGGNGGAVLEIPVFLV